MIWGNTVMWSEKSSISNLQLPWEVTSTHKIISLVTLDLGICDKVLLFLEKFRAYFQCPYARFEHWSSLSLRKRGKYKHNLKIINMKIYLIFSPVFGFIRGFKRSRCRIWGKSRGSKPFHLTLTSYSLLSFPFPVSFIAYCILPGLSQASGVTSHPPALPNTCLWLASPRTPLWKNL